MSDDEVGPGRRGRRVVRVARRQQPLSARAADRRVRSAPLGVRRCGCRAPLGAEPAVWRAARRARCYASSARPPTARLTTPAAIASRAGGLRWPAVDRRPRYRAIGAAGEAGSPRTALAPTVRAERGGRPPGGAGGWASTVDALPAARRRERSFAPRLASPPSRAPLRRHAGPRATAAASAALLALDAAGPSSPARGARVSAGAAGRRPRRVRRRAARLASSCSRADAARQPRTSARMPRMPAHPTSEDQDHDRDGDHSGAADLGRRLRRAEAGHLQAVAFGDLLLRGLRVEVVAQAGDRGCAEPGGAGAVRRLCLDLDDRQLVAAGVRHHARGEHEVARARRLGRRTPARSAASVTPTSLFGRQARAIARSPT